MIEPDTFHFWCMLFPGCSPKSTHRERRSASQGWGGNAWEFCVVVMHPSIHPYKVIPSFSFNSLRVPQAYVGMGPVTIDKAPNTLSLDPFYLTPQTSSRYFAGLTVATTKKRVVASMLAAHITLSWPHYLSFMLHLYWIWKDCKHQLNLLSENTQLIFESYLIETPTQPPFFFFFFHV